MTEIEELRLHVLEAIKELHAAVEEACPGPHELIQHRDGKPRWCPRCLRTADGELKNNMPSGLDRKSWTR